MNLQQLLFLERIYKHSHYFSHQKFSSYNSGFYLLIDISKKNIS